MRQLVDPQRPRNDIHVVVETYAERKRRLSYERYTAPLPPLARPAWFEEPHLRDKLVAGR